MIGVVTFSVMREPSERHEQLISLQHLHLDGRVIAFEQAVLSLAAQHGLPSWNCALRGISADGLDGLEGGPSLHALARDGRTIEGRVACPDSPLLRGADGRGA